MKLIANEADDGLKASSNVGRSASEDVPPGLIPASSLAVWMDAHHLGDRFAGEEREDVCGDFALLPTRLAPTTGSSMCRPVR
ncbi:hypothetical protein [Bradyrhizobium sp. I1.7.5]|uniref:hypothetical protein n=1 Tax=Bradyrhizobium sp. I1.7.5 TaxID=3156363 RepID=UPI003390B308